MYKNGNINIRINNKFIIIYDYKGMSNSLVVKIKKKIPLKKDTHHNFDVHYYNDKYSFIYIEFEDNEKFYEKIFEYFFNPDRLIKYIEGKSGIKFNRTKRDYSTLYKHLRLYIDDFNESKTIKELENEIKSILLDEDLLEEDEGVFKIRLDKIGRMGEYFFSCLLGEYFGFECVIPKIQLTSDPNMNVYGIDTLYYDLARNEILFGESKFCKSIENGVTLINKSLKTYEQQISDEFWCVLSNRFYKQNLNVFDDKYGDVAEVCISFEEFIKEADIKSIGIPIFIAHGRNLEKNEIIRKLSNIKKVDFLGVPTTYYCISLPIINKSKLVSAITMGIKERLEYYNEQRKYNK